MFRDNGTPVRRVADAAREEVTRPLIMVTHRVYPETLAMLAAAGEVLAPAQGREALSPAMIKRAARQATAMLAFMPDSVDEAFLAASPRLQIVAGALKGYDNFDAAACARRGVWLTVVPDHLTVPAAELTIGLMISLARCVRPGDNYVRSGRYRGWRPQFYGLGLDGETAGLIGFGAIGRALAARLKPFNMRLLYSDPKPVSSAEERRLGVEPVPLDELLRTSRYVILAAPLTPQTEHLIDERRLARMQPGALLINPSRGSLVDETAVLRALQSGRLGGYAADVFEMEDWLRSGRPRTVGKALRQHPNTLLTPHLGSAVVRARQDIERRAAENILDAFAGKPPRDAVAGPGLPPQRSGRGKP